MAVGPGVGGRTGGQHGEREHEQRPRSGDQPEMERRESDTPHTKTDDRYGSAFVKREVP